MIEIFLPCSLALCLETVPARTCTYRSILVDIRSIIVWDHDTFDYQYSTSTPSLVQNKVDVRASGRKYLTCEISYLTGRKSQSHHLRGLMKEVEVVFALNTYEDVLVPDSTIIFILSYVTAPVRTW